VIGYVLTVVLVITHGNVVAAGIILMLLWLALLLAFLLVLMRLADHHLHK
jgi:hypothetical protein